MLKLVCRKMDWYKRRIPVKTLEPVSVEIDDLQLINNHRCIMTVLYEDGIYYELSGRVNRNDQSGKWVVHGIDPHGKSVLMDIEEIRDDNTILR